MRKRADVNLQFSESELEEGSLHETSEEEVRISPFHSMTVFIQNQVFCGYYLELST